MFIAQDATAIHWTECGSGTIEKVSKSATSPNAP
jgi:hypothetical protein